MSRVFVYNYFNTIILDIDSTMVMVLFIVVYFYGSNLPERLHLYRANECKDTL